MPTCVRERHMCTIRADIVMAVTPFQLCDIRCGEKESSLLVTVMSESHQPRHSHRSAKSSRIGFDSNAKDVVNA